MPPPRKCQLLRETKCPCSIQHDPRFWLLEVQRRDTCCSSSSPPPLMTEVCQGEGSWLQYHAGALQKVVSACSRNTLRSLFCYLVKYSDYIWVQEDGNQGRSCALWKNIHRIILAIPKLIVKWMTFHLLLPSINYSEQ